MIISDEEAQRIREHCRMKVGLSLVEIRHKSTDLWFMSQTDVLEFSRDHLACMQEFVQGMQAELDSIQRSMNDAAALKKQCKKAFGPDA